MSDGEAQDPRPPVRRPERIGLGRRALGLGALAAAGGLMLGSRASAALPDDIRILVGTPLGSPYDRHARLLARHLPRLHSGMRITVETIPRAGGKLAAKLVHESAGDGRTIAMLPSGLIFAEILGEEGVAFSLPRLQWIGSLDAEPRVLVLSRRLGIDSFDALRRHAGPISLAAVSTASASWYEPLLLNRILGIRLKPVPGYSSVMRSGALMSGEVGAAIGSLETFTALLAEGHVNVVLRLNDLPLPGIAAPPPALVASEAAAAHPELMRLLDAHFRFGRAMCLGPRTPSAMTLAWRAAIDELVRDATYRGEIDAARLTLLPLPGAALETSIAAVFESAAAIRGALDAALACGMTIADNGPPGC
ncbi:MAG: hypothetical protein JNK67_11800 [Alphaproteobacteria bacterium]|nr:hypothetical protein [Alphaproteobacteria bacterium]